MQRIMTMVWLVQATLSIVMATAYLAVPERWHRLFHNVDLPRMLTLTSPTRPPGVSAEHMLMAVTVLRSDAEAIVTALRVMSVPTALLAFMSVYAAMRTDEETRRYIARTFGVVLSYWAGTIAIKAPLGLSLHLGRFSFESPHGDHILHNANESRLLFVIAAFAVINFVHGFIPVRNRRERALSGMANTRPPLLWVLWFAQSTLLLFAAGLVTWLTRGSRDVDITLADESIPRVAEAFRELHLGNPGLPFRSVLADVLETLPPMCVAIALFTFHAMLPSRQWVWRFLAGTFALHFATLVVVAGLVYQEGLLRPWVLPAVALPALVLGAFNLYYSLIELEYFTRETDGPDGWIPTDLFVGPWNFAKTVVRGGRRARNAAGVGARGRLEIAAQPVDVKLPDAVAKPVANAVPGDSMVPVASPAQVIPKLPPHDFFEAPTDAAKSPFEVIARFSNTTRDDDTAVDARGVALEITNTLGERFVLYFATGAYTEAPHVLGYAVSKVMSRVGFMLPRFLDTKPWVRHEARVASLRRPPTSYLDLTYHSQLVRFWVGIDHVRYLVRYRLVPCNVPAHEQSVHDDEAKVEGELERENKEMAARHAVDLPALNAREESELALHDVHVDEREERDADEHEARADRDVSERHRLNEHYENKRKKLRDERDAMRARHADALRTLHAKRIGAATDEAGSTTADAAQQVSSEHRASDCLRSELKRTLETQRPDVLTSDARAKMRLQAQLHRFANGDSSHWYNPSVDWRTDDHPWVDVGTLVLHTVMPDDEAEAHCFDLSACPHSLGVPEGTLPTDFRSLGDSQRRIVGRIQATRARLLVAFGVPASPNAPKDR